MNLKNLPKFLLSLLSKSKKIAESGQNECKIGKNYKSLLRCPLGAFGFLGGKKMSYWFYFHHLRNQRHRRHTSGISHSLAIGSATPSGSFLAVPLVGIPTPRISNNAATCGAAAEVPEAIAYRPFNQVEVILIP